MIVLAANGSGLVGNENTSSLPAMLRCDVTKGTREHVKTISVLLLYCLRSFE